ncbi:Lrp/AsnC family transcriptional regulator [Desulfovibrio sp. OttesenSCG-928-C06]|nr:Lrp/AsnC family transcriptional regulator [Desulfovibrio sp. OttesenSCG-928-C06]
MTNTPEELDGGAISETPALDEETLSESERSLLSLIQSGFPLEPRPYAILGKELGISEGEALDIVRGLRDKKIIRRLGANFDSAKLGFRSTLCAAKVPEHKLDEFIAAVNSNPGVTHNYLRDHNYNIWFTMIGSSWDKVLEDLAAIEEKTGISILNLPATRLYKIKVDFKLD